jgi:hypothetical protein
MGSDRDGDGNGREDENTSRSLWRLVRRRFDLICLFYFLLDFFASFLRFLHEYGIGFLLRRIY